MILSLPNPGEPRNLVFNYEPATGSITGRDSDRVLRLIDRSEGVARLPGNWPAIPVPDPARNPQDMAVLLTADGYILPPKLAELVPEQVDDSPPGSVS